MRRIAALTAALVATAAGQAAAAPPYDADVFRLGGRAESVRIGDLTGDGIPDVAFGGRAADGIRGRIWVYAGPDPAAARPLTAALPDDAADLAVADVNRDGRAELVVVTGTELWTLSAQGGVLRGLARSRLPGRGPPDALAVGDLDGDGLPDAVVNAFAFPGGTGGDAVRGDGTGRFGPALPGGFQIPPCIRGPASILIADLNRDARGDLAIADFCGRAALVALGVGGGAFSRLGPVPGPRYGIALGDLNGDGVLDLVSTSATAGSGSVQVRLGRGDGTFGAQRTWTDRRGFFQARLADADTDGRLDVVASQGFDAGSRFLDRGYTVLSGDGAGWFTAQTEVKLRALPKSVYSLDVGDLDGDGRGDVAGVSGLDDATGTVSVVRGLRLGVPLADATLSAPSVRRGGTVALRYVATRAATLDAALVAPGRGRPIRLARVAVRRGRGAVGVRIPRDAPRGVLRLRVAAEAAGVTTSRRLAVEVR
jgi:hypothetical protein